MVVADAPLRVGGGEEGTVIVPMTVVERKVFDDLTQGARVYALVASQETLESRIAGAAEAHTWRRLNLDRCMTAFSTDALGERIYTDGRTPQEVAANLGA